MMGNPRVVAGAVAVMLALGCSACGAGGGGGSSSSGSGSPSASSSSQDEGQKIASSLGERAKFLLDYKDKEYPRSDEETAMLQRAVDNGGVVSRADYEAAWNNYKQCLVDKGYVAPQLYKYPHGLYDLPATDHNGLTQEQSDKADSDAVYCYSTYTMQVNDQYCLQFGNEALTSDDYQAIVDCLHKQGVAPASYTKEQYKNDAEEWEDSLASGDDSASPQDASASANEESAYHIDFDDPNASECLVANGWSYDNGLKTEWRPLG